MRACVRAHPSRHPEVAVGNELELLQFKMPGLQPGVQGVLGLRFRVQGVWGVQGV